MMYRLIKETLVLSVFLFLAVICLLMGSNMTQDLPEEEAAVFCATRTGIASTPELDLGKELFKANCATCHNKNMKDRLTGRGDGALGRIS